MTQQEFASIRYSCGASRQRAAPEESRSALLGVICHKRCRMNAKSAALSDDIRDSRRKHGLRQSGSEDWESNFGCSVRAGADPNLAWQISICIEFERSALN